MHDSEFEWSVDKAATNFASHGVPFEHARLVFKDVGTVAEHDDRFDYGEDRFSIIGMVDGTLLYVAYTERGERIRIIMARRATRHEQDDYFEQNGRSS